MFEVFDVADKITYGTFSKISEKLINEKGDLRELALDIFSNRQFK